MWYQMRYRGCLIMTRFRGLRFCPKFKRIFIRIVGTWYHCCCRMLVALKHVCCSVQRLYVIVYHTNNKFLLWYVRSAMKLTWTEVNQHGQHTKNTCAHVVTLGWQQRREQAIPWQCFILVWQSQSLGFVLIEMHICHHSCQNPAGSDRFMQDNRTLQMPKWRDFEHVGRVLMPCLSSQKFMDSSCCTATRDSSISW